MDEADFKRSVVSAFRANGDYARRIEDQYSVGFPDLILIPAGGPVFFCEAKIVRGASYAATPRQGVELQRLDVSPDHSVPCVLGFDGILTYLHERAKICYVERALKKSDNENMPDFFRRFYNERILPWT